MIKDMYNQFMVDEPTLRAKVPLKYGQAYDFYSRENKATMTVLIAEKTPFTKNKLLDLIDRDIIKIIALTFSDGVRCRE